MVSGSAPLVHTAGGALPFKQPAPHTPALQNWLTGQAIPHLLQLFASLLRFTSHPSARLLLQSAKPGLHPPNPHTPLTQVCIAFAMLHFLPQPPQLLMSDAV